MTKANQPADYFTDAHRHRRDITDTYLALGDIPKLVGVSADNEIAILTRVRQLLLQEGGIPRLSTLGQPAHPEAQQLYQADRIAAIDGTDAISPLRFVSDTIYASAVLAVSPQSRHEPRVRITRTRASSYASTRDFSGGWEEEVRLWGEYLRGAREQEISWVSTFREYEEREFAHQLLTDGTSECVLIDGPILTQNLLSQRTARTLLETLISSDSVIGFIKDLSANPLLMAIGCALQPGEAFVLSHWSNLLGNRFSRGQEAISTWIKAKANHVVRCIYKTNHKAYGVECTQKRVPLSLAILNQDPGGPADHDIPMLLQIADAHVRARFRGTAARDEVLARYSLNEPKRFLELTNERSFR